MRSDLAGMHHNLGLLLMKQTDRLDEAEQRLRQANQTWGNLSNTFPDVPDYRRGQADSYHALGNLFRDIGQLEDAQRAYGNAGYTRAKLNLDFPDVPTYRFDLTSSYNTRAGLHRQAGRLKEAEADYREAVNLCEELAAELPGEPKYRRQLAESLSELGVLLQDEGQFSEAETVHRRVIRIRQALVEEFPHELIYPGDLAGSLHNLASIRQNQGELLEARRLYEQAISHQRVALRANPEHPTYRQFLRNHYGNLANILMELGDYAEAARMAADLAHVFPDRWRDARDAAYHLIECVSLVEQDEGLPHAERQVIARSYADQARTLLQDAIRRGSDDVEAQNSVAWLLATCNDPRFRDPPRAITLARKAVERAPGEWAYWDTLGIAYYRAGDWDAAIDALEKAIELSCGVDGPGFFLAMAHWQRGERDEARRWYDRAIQWMAHQTPSDGLRHLRNEAAALLGLDDTLTDNATGAPQAETNSK